MINFVSDIYIDGMLYGVTVRSSVSKGKIVSIKIPKLPKGYYAVSADNIPGKKTLNTCGKKCPSRTWLAEGNINYKGEPVLLLAGPDKNILNSLALKVSVRYKKENAVLKTITAETIDDYTCSVVTKRRGNIEAAFKDAYQIVEEEYSTGVQRQFHEEPQAAVSIWNGNRLIVFSNTQDPFGVRQIVSELLKVPKKKVRVLVPPADNPLVSDSEETVQDFLGLTMAEEGNVPGSMNNSDTRVLYSNFGFNGRLIDSIVVAGHASLLSFITGKPVKMLYSIDEDFKYASKRYPVITRYKTALDKSGIPTGIKVEIVMDIGAYIDGAEEVFNRILVMVAGSYRFPNAEITGKLVKTDRIPFGISVGTGTPQAFLGLELHTARLAEIAQLDPYIWKKKNLSRGKGILSSGSRFPDYRGADYVLDRVVEKSDFQRKYAAYETLKKRRTSLSDKAGPLRGIGLALCFQGMSVPSDTALRKYSLRIKLGRDENISVYSTFQNVELVKSAVLSIAKERLGLKKVSVSTAKIDTDMVPDTGPSKPLTESVLIQRLVSQCVSSIQKKRFNSPLPIEIKKAHKIPAALKKPADARTTVPFSSVSWAAVVTEVELDPLSFEVFIRGVWVSIDGGSIYLSKAEEKGIKQDIIIGLNFAAGAGMEFDSGEIFKDWNGIQNSYYAGALPKIDISFIENEMHRGKDTGYIKAGIHGLSVAAIAPAYVSAVSQATGFYPNKLPVTPLTIQEYLESV